MARVLDVRRSGTISQVAPQATGAGLGWSALANLAKIGSDFLEPLVDEQAQEKGFERVYRDKDGTLKVDKANVLGGRSAEIQNAAAYSKYLSQKAIDISSTFTELANANEFNPAGFKEGADAYIRSLGEENLPAAIKEEILQSAQSESRRIFNGLFNSATDRNYRESDRNTKAHRDMLADDYVSLYMQGEFDEAEAKLAELESLTQFRVNAPYISETDKEAESYLRGVRGSGKVAWITQQLANEPFSDALRAEAEKILDDPDLSPQARQRLSTAVQGAIKGVEGKAVAEGLASDTYSAKVRRAESSNNPNAKNPLSSATGLHQFIDSTWLSNVKELRAMGQAEWAQGLTEDQLLAMRTNEQASEEVFQHFRQKNARALVNAGMPVTDGTEYLAHFLGAGGAIKLLSSDPNARAGDVLESVIPGFSKANPGMGDMTVAEVQAWANRKMTVKASDIALAQSTVSQIEDPELRGIASGELRRMYDARRALEAQSLLEYQTRLTERDSLTEAEIRNDHGLSDSAQNALVSELRKLREDEVTVASTLAALNAGAGFNPYETADRNAIDMTFKASIGDQQPLSAEGQAAGADLSVRSGIMPKSMFTAVRGALNSGDPAAFASAAEFTGQVMQRQPGAIDAYDGSKGVQDRLADYTFFSQFMGPEEAAARVIENNSPEMQSKRKNLSDAAKDAAKSLAPEDVTEFLSERVGPVEVASDAQMAPIMEDYDRLFRDAFTATGDADLAKNRALTEMSRIYGPNLATGDRTIMKYPPHRSYPADPEAPRGEEYSWMTAQIEDAVRPLMGDLSFLDRAAEVLAQGMALDPSIRVPIADRVRLVSDDITRREISRGTPPSYTLYYTDGDGVTQMAPERFFFEPPEPRSNENQGQREAQFQNQREQQQRLAYQEQWVQFFKNQYGYDDSQARAAVLKNAKEFGSRPPGEDDAVQAE